MENQTVEVKFNDSDEWEVLTVQGKRRGYLRLGWPNGKTKWVDLKTVTMKENDNVKVATTGSARDVTAGITETAETQQEEEEVEAAGPAEPEAGAPVSAETSAQFTNMTRGLNYYDQAAFFLNAYWLEYEGEAQQIFEICKMMAAQDKRDGDNGVSLDEVNARKILQDLDMAMSRQKYLDEMRNIDVNNDRKMSMLEFLLYKNSISPADLLARPQNGMTSELQAAYENVEGANAVLQGLHDEKAALEEVASGTGVSAMRARTQLSNFKVRDFKDANYDITIAEKKVSKALQSPELREKGTEFIAQCRGIAAAPKQAAAASSIEGGGADVKAVNFEEQLWKEDLVFWIRQASYRQQAGFFLNAYFDEIGPQAEVVWEYALSCEEFDTKSGVNGCYLDEGQTTNFMRQNVEDYDLTANQLRKKLANEICLNNDKRMSLIEFLLNNFELDVQDMMTRPQGEPSDTVRNMKIKIKEIEKEEAEWNAKVAANDELAASGGVRAMGAKNLQSQGYGQKELRTLDDQKIKCNKKLTRAENSDDMQEPGFVWIMERQAAYDAEPRRG